MEFRRLSTRTDIRVLSKVNEAIEPLAFHCVIALLRTDRNHEQNLCVLVYVHCPNHGQYRHRVSGHSPQSVHFFWAQKLPCSTLCSLFFTFHATLLSQSACREVFVPQNRARARISLMRFAFFDNASRLSFFFPEFCFVPGASQEFHGVSRRGVQSQFSCFP